MKNVSSQQVQDIIKYQEFNEKINEYLKNSQANQQLQNPTQFHDEKGNLYMVKGWFFKKLVKIQNEKEEVIIDQTLLQNLFNGYLIPWLFAFLGIICFLFANMGIITQNAAGPERFSIRKTFIDIFK